MWSANIPAGKIIERNELIYTGENKFMFKLLFFLNNTKIKKKPWWKIKLEGHEKKIQLVKSQTKENTEGYVWFRKGKQNSKQVYKQNMRR